MSKAILYFVALAFYVTLTLYVGSEFYYNQTYWRLVLRKKRRSRWEFLLWLERIVLIILGLIVVVLTLAKG